jgi:hypothetical protein
MIVKSMSVVGRKMTPAKMAIAKSLECVNVTLSIKRNFVNLMS